MNTFASLQNEFNLAEFAIQRSGKQKEPKTKGGNLTHFFLLCESLKMELDQIEADEKVKDANIERFDKAIQGNKLEMTYYINKISKLLEEKHLSDEWYPGWYKNLSEAVFHESYGYAGIAEWMDDQGDYKDSPACKIIGENIFFEINGSLVSQPQTISPERFLTLRNMLIATDPTQVAYKAYHELRVNGKRISIYHKGIAKEGQSSMVFRRYLDNVYTLEEQAERHTIPKESIPLLKNLNSCGFNIAITGPPKVGKTTILEILLSMKNPKREGVLIESSDEIQGHKRLQGAPLMQLVPTKEYEDVVISTAKRSDVDYVVIGEARNGKYMDIFVDSANMGTRDGLYSLHTMETIDFPFDVADKLTRECGGDLGCNMIKVAKSVHYIINMFKLPSDKGQKRLKGIWEMRYDNENLKITMHQICKYRPRTDDWVWSYDIGPDKREIAEEENWTAFEELEKILKKLAEESPNQGKTVFEPAFLKVWRGKF